MKIISIICFIVFLAGCQHNPNASVSHYFRSDDRVTTDIEAAFYKNELLSGTPIHIETHEGRVSLEGYVKTIRQSDVAGEIAGSIAGPDHVDNNLIVKK